MERMQHLGVYALDTSELAGITRSCGLVTVPPGQRDVGLLVPPMQELVVQPPPEEISEEFWLPAEAGRPDTQVCYSDGSGQHTQMPHRLRTSGYGVWWGEHHPWQLEERVVGPWQSSQRAELSGILYAGFQAAEAQRSLLVRTDSSVGVWGGPAVGAL